MRTVIQIFEVMKQIVDHWNKLGDRGALLPFDALCSQSNNIQNFDQIGCHFPLFVRELFLEIIRNRARVTKTKAHLIKLFLLLCYRLMRWAKWKEDEEGLLAFQVRLEHGKG